MSVEIHEEAVEIGRPETSKRSRATSRQDRAQNYMRSTSINFSRGTHENSPVVRRKNTLERRKIDPSPEPPPRPSSQQQCFRTGMTLQQFIANGPDAFEPDPHEFGHKDEQLVVDWRSNFRIEEMNEDEEDQSRRESTQSKPSLQQQPQVPARSTRKSPALGYQYNLAAKSAKRSNNITATNFYGAHRRLNSNLEKFEANEEYLLKKYAEKFKLNDQAGRRRVDTVIHKVSNESLAKMKNKFGRFT